VVDSWDGEQNHSQTSYSARGGHGRTRCGCPFNTSTSITVPDAEGALAGTYDFSTSYNAAGQVTSTTFPEAGDLPEEVVSNDHTSDGYLESVNSDLGGGTTYVKDTVFAGDGKLASRMLGDAGDGQTERIYGYDAETQRLASIGTLVDGAVVQDDAYAYDASGNVTGITDETSGQSQCFTHDAKQRMTRAWTTDVACDQQAPNPNHAFGPDPYDTSYGYDSIGNVTLVTDNVAAETTDYSYPASGQGSVRPHAATGAGSDSFGYDENGSMTSRTVDGVDSSLSWDVLNRLTSVTTDGEATQNVYGADGDRLLRHDPSGSTLYLPGMELREAGGTLTATRYYTAGGATVGMRTPAGQWWLAADHQASTQISMNASTGEVSRRRYTPFGDERGSVGQLPTDRGFLGKTEDSSTGLVHLGARFYDPALARFISVHPLLDNRTPQSMNAYTYSGNNPVTHSDPSGLRFIAGGGTDYVGKRNSHRSATRQSNTRNRAGTWYANYKARNDTAYNTDDIPWVKKPPRKSPVKRPERGNKNPGNKNPGNADGGPGGDKRGEANDRACSQPCWGESPTQYTREPTPVVDAAIERTYEIGAYHLNHATASWEACLGVCVGGKFQGGHASISAGGGFFSFGGSIGWANLTASEREQRATGVFGSYGIGGYGEMGFGSNNELNPQDWEAGISGGVSAGAH
jgi:RHS repeat-associated protein